MIMSNETYSNNSGWKKVSAFRFRLGILIRSKIIKTPLMTWFL